MLLWGLGHSVDFSGNTRPLAQDRTESIQAVYWLCGESLESFKSSPDSEVHRGCSARPVYAGELGRARLCDFHIASCGFTEFRHRFKRLHSIENELSKNSTPNVKLILVVLE